MVIGLWSRYRYANVEILQDYRGLMDIFTAL